ncbi:hypothetical protein [Algivirga pacifica]|uniref:Uncharacterized protein n=1 Tax=Algivirga pacifica TaxID=1162670 RepID=A0ABP9DE93_9BACT
MKKSIEDIWKEGFLNKEALVAPKLNHLYNQKSVDLIEQIIHMGKLNIVMILIFGILLLLIGVLIPLVKLPFLLLSAGFIGLSIFAFWKDKRIVAIDKGKNSYDYLKNFDAALKTNREMYARLYRFFYPAVFLAMMLGFVYSAYGDRIIGQILFKFPDLWVVAGVPAVILGPIILIASFMMLFSRKIFEWDVKIVYGRVLMKLEEMIEDMEELRKGDE